MSDLMDSKSKAWFSKVRCEELKIQKFENVSSPIVKTKLLINDLEYIYSLQTTINQLPVTGEIMVDVSAKANYLTLEFKCGSNIDVIEFYDSRIKTPATSFYIRSEKREESVWLEIQELLNNKPKFGTQIPFFLGHILNFGNFSLTYLGVMDKTPKGTTASLSIQSFRVQSTIDKKEKIIEVKSGQLPAKPITFEINNNKYSLHTFSIKKLRLNPRHLLVEKLSE